MVDHLAENDEHALSIVRDIVARLNSVKEVDIDLADPVPPKMDLEALWSMAQLHSLFDLRSKEQMENIWAHSNLIELYLLAPALPPGHGLPATDAARKGALEHTDALIDLAGRGSFEVYSTRRQIFRYKTWFNSIAPRLAEPLGGVADAIFAKFPKGIEDKWK